MLKIYTTPGWRNNITVRPPTEAASSFAGDRGDQASTLARSCFPVSIDGLTSRMAPGPAWTSWDWRAGCPQRETGVGGSLYARMLLAKASIRNDTTPPIGRRRTVADVPTQCPTTQWCRLAGYLRGQCACRFAKPCPFPNHHRQRGILRPLSSCWLSPLSDRWEQSCCEPAPSPELTQSSSSSKDRFLKTLANPVWCRRRRAISTPGRMAIAKERSAGHNRHLPQCLAAIAVIAALQ